MDIVVLDLKKIRKSSAALIGRLLIKQLIGTYVNGGLNLFGQSRRICCFQSVFFCFPLLLFGFHQLFVLLRLNRSTTWEKR